MQNLIIPFKVGKGKNGNAKTGIPHAILLQTLTYNSTFKDFDNYINTIIKNNHLKESDKKTIVDTLLKDMLVDDIETLELTFPNVETGVVFFNPIRIKNKYRHLTEFKVENDVFILDKILNECDLLDILVN